MGGVVGHTSPVFAYVAIYTHYRGKHHSVSVVIDTFLNVRCISKILDQPPAYCETQSLNSLFTDLFGVPMAYLGILHIRNLWMLASM